MKLLVKLVVLLTALLANTLAYTQTSHTWKQWVAQVRTEALSQGISASIFDTAFATIQAPNHKIQGLARSQPEHRLTYPYYLKTRADHYRIALGRKKFTENSAILRKIGQEYKVDPCFIVSFWGMESSYGSYMGTFPVIQSLATLAYDSTRQPFFRQELFIALHILQDKQVALKDFKGEWAGASGQPQFLPSSWVDYAVDYDGDGRKDIWSSKADVFASIANYMKKNGWQADQPWAIYIKLPHGFDQKLVSKTITKSVAEWSDLGVTTLDDQTLPYPTLQASIIHPDSGPVFLALPNYKMILKYNNSIYYAGAIGTMADQICNR